MAGRRRSRRTGRAEPSPEQRAARIIRDLRALAGTVATHMGPNPAERVPVAELVASGLKELSLSLKVSLSPPDPNPEEDGAEPDATPLLRAVEQQVEHALRGTVRFELGCVYCFHCETSRCAHARPQDAQQIFSGYAPIGRPEWQSFTNACLDRHEPRVDRLFGDAPEVIAFTQLASELKAGLLPGFGRSSGAYDVLGQVAAGLVPADLRLNRGNAMAGAERVAITLQIVETRLAGEGRRLRLNLLGLPQARVAEAAASGDPRAPAERFRRTIAATRQRLEALERRLLPVRSRGAPVELESAVKPLLSRLRGDVERVFSPERHRTQHARERHQGGQRPTSLAVTDASNVSDDGLLYDTVRETIVVIGPRGRAHVFSKQGRQVTSLKLEPGELTRKTGRARWQPLSPSLVKAFRQSLKGTGG